MRGYFQPLSANVPAGTVVFYAGVIDDDHRRSLAISGWLVCDGRAKPTIVTAHELYEAIGERYSEPGGANGAFGIPDFRGRFLRALADDDEQDPGRGVRVGPVTDELDVGVGSRQVEMVQQHEHDYVPPIEGNTGDVAGGAAVGQQTPSTDLLGSDGKELAGDETRPKNVYLYLLIRFSTRVGLANLAVDLGVPKTGAAGR